MKVAGNKVSHLTDFFHGELDGLYGVSEVNSLIAIAFEHYLGFARSEMSMRANENLNQSDLLKLYDCCKALKTGRPLQYILKEAWFYGLRFFVNEHVLVPRPETEELVDDILRENKTMSTLLDIGTGSGCIPVSIKRNLNSCEVSACDISQQALEVAKKNAALNEVHVDFFEADVLNIEGFETLCSKTFDTIASNPPYIKLSEKNSMHQNVLDHEPHLALFVNGEDEIIFYRRIIGLCKNKLNANGKLYFELNPLTATNVKKYAEETGMFVSVELKKDLSGNIRFLKAIKK